MHIKMFTFTYGYVDASIDFIQEAKAFDTGWEVEVL